MIEGCAIVLGSLSRLQQRGKFLHQPLPQCIDSFQFPDNLPACRISADKLPAVGSLSPDAKGKDIPLQHIHFLGGKSGKPAPQIMKNGLVGKILNEHLQGGAYQLDKRV